MSSVGLLSYLLVKQYQEFCCLRKVDIGRHILHAHVKVYRTTFSGMGDPIESSETIEPTHQIHHVTGDMSISTITLPLGFVGELILIPDEAWTTDTTGNIKNNITATIDSPVRCVYDNNLKKWYLVA